MKFRYSLQKVVDLKENEKTQAEWLLTAALNKLRMEEATLQELENIQASLFRQLEETTQHRTSVHELQAMQHYLDYIETLIQNKKQDIYTAQVEVQDKQEGLTARMLEEKVWHKAKEKAYQFFVDATRKKEQQELDEIASVRFGN